MLLQGRLRSFLQKCVDTLVEVVRGHVVVDNAEASDVNSSLIGASIDIIGHFCQLTLLLDHLDRFPIRSTLRCSNTLLFATCLIGDTSSSASLLLLN